MKTLTRFSSRNRARRIWLAEGLGFFVPCAVLLLWTGKDYSWSAAQEPWLLSGFSLADRFFSSFFRALFGVKRPVES